MKRTRKILLCALASILPLAAQDARRFDPAIFTQAATYPDPLVRSQAALGMGRIGDTTAFRLLLDLLNDEDSVVRRAAAWALSSVRTEDADAALAKALADPSLAAARTSRLWQCDLGWRV